MSSLVLRFFSTFYEHWSQFQCIALGRHFVFSLAVPQSLFSELRCWERERVNRSCLKLFIHIQFTYNINQYNMNYMAHTPSWSACNTCVFPLCKFEYRGVQKWTLILKLKRDRGMKPACQYTLLTFKGNEAERFTEVSFKLPFFGSECTKRH